MTWKQWASIGLLVWNVVTFIAYGVDKGRARRGAYRTPEKTLLGMALIFGGIGAYAGGQFFHHKTRKWYFQATWVVGMLVDAACLYLIWR